MSDNPKCPYCGDEMEYYWDNNPMMPRGFYYCVTCGCRAPSASTQAIAREAAMWRFPEGDWVIEETAEIGGIWVKWCCDECGYVRTQGWKSTKDGKKPKAKYCENCGAKMRKGKDDER